MKRQLKISLSYSASTECGRHARHEHCKGSKRKYAHTYVANTTFWSTTRRPVLRTLVFTCLCLIISVTHTFSLIIGDFEGSMDGWTPTKGTAQIVYSDSFSRRASVQVSANQGWGGIFRMYPIGSQIVSARVKVMSGQVGIMVCYDYAAHCHFWWNEFVGPSDEWQLILVNGPSPYDEICVYATGGPAVFLVDYIKTGAIFPIVDKVSVSQRGDATKFVDIDYNLEDESGEPQTIGLLVSDNGGSSWNIDPTAVSGDIGNEILPGSNKHIVWNPTIDIPGVGGENFKVRAFATPEHYADSNVISIIAPGPGDLQGTALD